MSRRMVLLAVLVPVLSGCIRDTFPDCPPLQIEIGIKDKNYFNIDDAVKLGLAERKAEDLPFRDYVSSLYYVITDEHGNVVKEQTNLPVTDDALTQVVTLPYETGYGRYSITVWGNMASDRPLGDDFTDADLSDDDIVFSDIYLASADFTYYYGSEHHQVLLERAKGNLMIKAENIPDNIDFSTKLIEDVYGIVRAGFTYSGLTDISTELDWEDERVEIMSQTLLAPSAEYEGTTLNVNFLESSSVRDGDNTSLVPKPVRITVSRNQITIIRYVYTDEGRFDIYVRVNDEWELIHEMDLE